MKLLLQTSLIIYHCVVYSYAASSGVPQKSKPDVIEIHVNTDIKHRYATTVISCRVANAADVAQEVGYTFVIPERAFISGFVMEIKGKEYKALITEKENAKQDYAAVVKEGLGAGHVEQLARDSNQFKVSVNIEPHSKVKFSLKYEELLARTEASYKHVVNINPGQIVGNMSVIVNILESSKITKIEVPNIKLLNDVTAEDNDINNKVNPYALIERNSMHSAAITWAPTADQQRKLTNDGILGQLIVEYDVDRGKPQEVLLEDGYFVHFFAPTDLKPLPKHVVFALDVSGSMIGNKLKQLKAAITRILFDLREEDYFSVILFADYAQLWLPRKDTPTYAIPTVPKKNLSELIVRKEHVVRATDENKNAACDDITYYNDDFLGTNIIAALRSSLELVEIGREVTKETANIEPMIVFLTDGQPTVELYDNDEILKKVDELNVNKVTIYTLGFGNGTDEKFLKQLSLKYNSFCRIIYEAADATSQLTGFFHEIASPLLSNVTFKYIPSQVDQESSTKINFSTYNNGSEIVVAGKLKPSSKSPDPNESGQLVAQSANGATSYSIPWNHTPYNPQPLRSPTINRLEKVWAYLTTQQLLNKLQALPDDVNIRERNKQTIKEKIKEKILSMAITYQFVTPLTSLLVVKPYESTTADAEHVVPPAVTQADSSAANSFDAAPASLAGFSTSQVDYSDLIKIHPLFKKGSLDDLPWLYKHTKDNITFTLPLSTGPANFSLGHNQHNESFHSCALPTFRTEVTGGCRHLKHCVLKAFYTDVKNYLPYQCDIKIYGKNYLGVCCPDDYRPTTTKASTDSSEAEIEF